MNIEFPIPFTKMSGTGNDFIIMDHRRPFIPVAEQAEFARLVCRRKFSAGADGLILIETVEATEQADFSWRFFNADGSLAEMCGNGARCAARFAAAHNIAPLQMRFLTQAGIIEAKVSEESVRIRLTRPADIRLNLTLEVAGVKHLLHFINTGVPHVVCFVEEINAVPVRELGRLIRYAPFFQPAGTNVNFVQANADKLLVRTYERGVEDETLACGTGATAAALVAALLDRAASPVPVVTTGGETLTIHFTLSEPHGSGVDEVFLEGPAHFIYQGRLTPEALRS